ncbi:STAS domain-containing protein [Pseudonocardia sp. GCM10023141]|uniref:STAS domain-containing protein n=1 Tax=Pseudonocardia sp. GCM10023141 TaxID=3252653 RepID=UPI003611E0D5
MSSGGARHRQTAPVLAQRLCAQFDRPGRHVIIDLGGVTFLGSSALQAFMEAHERARAHDGVLHIACGGRRHLLRPFTITGLDRVLSVSVEPADALAAAPRR